MSTYVVGVEVRVDGGLEDLEEERREDSAAEREDGMEASVGYPLGEKDILGRQTPPRLHLA